MHVTLWHGTNAYHTMASMSHYGTMHVTVYGKIINACHTMPRYINACHTIVLCQDTGISMHITLWQDDQCMHVTLYAKIYQYTSHYGKIINECMSHYIMAWCHAMHVTIYGKIINMA